MQVDWFLIMTEKPVSGARLRPTERKGGRREGRGVERIQTFRHDLAVLEPPSSLADPTILATGPRGSDATADNHNGFFFKQPIFFKGRPRK
jgi:hypothetical protein